MLAVCGAWKRNLLWNIKTEKDATLPSITIAIFVVILSANGSKVLNESSAPIG